MVTCSACSRENARVIAPTATFVTRRGKKQTRKSHHRVRDTAQAVCFNIARDDVWGDVEAKMTGAEKTSKQIKVSILGLI